MQHCLPDQVLERTGGISCVFFSGVRAALSLRQPPRRYYEPEGNHPAREPR